MNETSSPVTLDYDNAAAQFDRVLPYLSPLTDAMLAHLPALSAGTQVLDLGCGTGEPGLSLGRNHPEVLVLGIDSAPAMIEVARSKVRRDSLANVRFEVMSMENLTLAPNSQDIAISRLALLQFEDWLASTRELARVLKVDGHYCIAAWDRLSSNVVAHAVYVVLRDLLPEQYTSLFRTFDEKATKGPREKWLRDAGMRSVSTEIFYWDYQAADFATIWEILSGPGTFQQMFAPLNDEQRAEASEHLREVLSQYRTAEGSYIIPHECRLLWGQR